MYELFKRRTTIRKLLLILGGVGGLVIVYWILFGAQTCIYLVALVKLGGRPELNQVPRPLKIENFTETDGTIVSFYGCSAGVPWKEKVQEDDLDSAGRVFFKCGKSIAVLNPKDSIDYKEALVEELSPSDKGRMLEIYGSETLQSKHSLLGGIFDATPTKLSPFTSKKQAFREFSLLSMKLMFATTAETGIRSFEEGVYKGCTF